MRNRLLISLFTVLFLFTLLAGCGSESSEPESTSTESSSITESENSENEEKVSSLYSIILDEEKPLTDRILVGLDSGESTLYEGRSILLGKTYEITMDVNHDTIDEYFRIGLDSPNGTRVLAAVENRGVNLINGLTMDSAFDDVGDIKEEMYLQLSLFDLDGDGDLDVILSVGNLLDLSESAFYLFTGSEFTFAGSAMSGARMQYYDGMFIASDETAYVIADGKLQVLGEDGELEEQEVAMDDDALAALFADLVQPLVITLPNNFSDPTQIDRDTLLNIGLFGFIVNSSPDARVYTDNEVCIPSAQIDNQLAILFGDRVSVSPQDYVNGEFVYYNAEDDTYRMPIAGYAADVVRVESLEKQGDNYLITCALIPYIPGEDYASLEGMTPSRTVKYTLTTSGNQYIVIGLENLY